MMAETLDYWDACALLGAPPALWAASSLERDERFVMVKSEHGPDSIRHLGSVPRSTKSMENRELNLTWYLTWQVLYVVDCFADGFLRQDGDEVQRVACTVDALCKQANIESCLLDFARDRGMIDVVDWGFERLCKPATKIEYIEKSHTGKISKKTKHNMKAEAKSEKKYVLPTDQARNTKSEPKIASRKAKAEPKPDCPLSASHERKKKKAPVKRRALPSSGTRPPARVIYEGPPGRDELSGPGEPMENGWPPGWKKRICQRQSGGTMGDTDRYWITPNKRKLRSLLQIKRYLAHLAIHNDEPAAYRASK
jgi:Methyl-CpG binding domain